MKKSVSEYTRILRNTAEGFLDYDAVVPTGVLAYETDTGSMKVGDGVQKYSQLSYSSRPGDVDPSVVEGIVEDIIDDLDLGSGGGGGGESYTFGDGIKEQDGAVSLDTDLTSPVTINSTDATYAINGIGSGAVALSNDETDSRIEVHNGGIDISTNESMYVSSGQSMTLTTNSSDGSTSDITSNTGGDLIIGTNLSDGRYGRATFNAGVYVDTADGFQAKAGVTNMFIVTPGSTFILLFSPNGTPFQLKVSDAGVLSTQNFTGIEF